MRRKIIISLIILVITILGGVGVWAYKTGKLAGLADIIQGNEVGVIVSVKYDDGKPGALVMLESCFLEKCKDWVCQTTTNTNEEGKAYFITDCSKNPDTPGCPGYSGPPAPEILYTKLRPVKDGYCSMPPFAMLRYADQISKLNYLDFVLKLDGRCGSAQGKSTISGFVYDNEITHYMPDEARRYEPIEGAKISIGGVSDGNERVSLNTMSKADGTFEINNVPAGVDYELICYKEGYGTYKKRASVVPNEQYFYNIGLELPPPQKDKFTLIGKLTKANSSDVIADASIRVSWTIAGTTFFSPESKSTTDQKYNIVVEDIPLKPEGANYYIYHISINHPEYEVLEQDIGFRIDELQYDREWGAWVWGRDFVLSSRPIFAVFGTVKEKLPEPNMPVEGATVIIELYKGTEPQRSYSAITDKNGSYLINNVAFNPYLLYYFKVEHHSYNKIKEGPQQFLTLPLMQNPDRAAIEKNFILMPGGIDCKKILGERCPACQR